MPSYTSRKYVDIILKASSKWGTLEPFSKKIEVGDFGKINEETGEFDYRGNIYKHEEVLDYLPEIGGEAYKPVVSEPIDQWIIAGGKSTHGEIDSDAEINSKANLEMLQSKLSLNSGRGVVGLSLSCTAHNPPSSRRISCCINFMISAR